MPWVTKVRKLIISNVIREVEKTNPHGQFPVAIPRRFSNAVPYMCVALGWSVPSSTCEEQKEVTGAFASEIQIGSAKEHV